MRKRSKSASAAGAICSALPVPGDPRLCFEGENLSRFLESLKREIESVRDSDSSLPQKIWFKQNFAIGVNEVTRVLERMSPLRDIKTIPSENDNFFSDCGSGKSAKTNLQAIVMASDCNPRWLTKHLPGLAASRNVPLISVKDRKEGSVRLGQVFNLKTAIAIGIKENGNTINQLIKELSASSVEED